MLHKFQPHEMAILAAFKRAYDEGEFNLVLPDAAACISLRARGYAITKKTRTLVEKGHAPEVVLNHLESVTMSIVQTTLRFRRKDRDPAMAALIDQLGGAAEVNKADPMEAELAEMAQRLQAAAQSAPAFELSAAAADYLKPARAPIVPAVKAPESERERSPSGSLLPAGWTWDHEKGVPVKGKSGA